MTKTEVASLAISHLGGRNLIDVDSDTSMQAEACRKWFDVARDEFLRAYAWSFATSRARLTQSYTSISGVANNGSGLFRISATSHGLSTGDRVFIKDAAGSNAINGRWYVTVINANTFDLQDSTFSTGYTGSAKFVKIPLFNWLFQFTPPADFLRPLQTNGYDGNLQDDSEPYFYEKGLFLANEETINLLYVAKVTDYDDWPTDAVAAFSYLLASYISADIVGTGTIKASEMRQAYQQAVTPIIRALDANQQKPPRTLPWFHGESQLVDARLGVIQTA